MTGKGVNAERAAQASPMERGGKYRVVGGLKDAVANAGNDDEAKQHCIG